MADKNYYGNQEHIKVTPGITVTYNYNRLKNKPSINGKPLDGKMTASDLNLLSNNVTEYEEIKLGVDKRDSFILVVGENGETNKIKLGELVKGKLQTVDKITEDIPDGDFVFKKMEDR